MSDNLDKFDWKFYCNYYGDLRAAGINTEKKALDHYLQHGKNENRVTNIDSSRQLIISPPGNSINVSDILPSKSFFEIGQQFCNYISQLIEIPKNANVLEIGCGVGSMALAFSRYLSPPGHYNGVDIDRNCIDWCRSKITSSYNHANFQYLPLDPKSSNFRLPYNDRSMDFIFSTSFFTSLNPDDVKIYLSEVNRILKSGGKCLIIYFLWNPFIDILYKEGKTSLKLIDNFGEYRNICNSLREKAVSLPESTVIQLHESSKLPIIQIIYGNWSGNSSNNFYQDLIICVKK